MKKTREEMWSVYGSYMCEESQLMKVERRQTSAPAALVFFHLLHNTDDDFESLFDFIECPSGHQHIQIIPLFTYSQHGEKVQKCYKYILPKHIEDYSSKDEIFGDLCEFFDSLFIDETRIEFAELFNDDGCLVPEMVSMIRGFAKLLWKFIKHERRMNSEIAS